MDEFLKAWSQIQWVPVVIEYKVYYNTTTGNILDYTTDDLPGTYITVDKDTFHRHRFDMKVKDGKLVATKPTVGKLCPSDTGTPCHPADITIVTDNTPAIFWKNHTYDN